MSGKLYLGTSGWAYSHWKGGVFYPAAWKEHELKYYSQFFNSVEINTSFYHWPPKSTFDKWRTLVPDDFIFSVKASRYLTHLLKLKKPREPLARIFASLAGLKKKLGSLLFQLPPNFAAEEKSLAKFLKLIPDKYRIAFEFRHPSWFDKKTFTLLQNKNAALVMADTPKYPLVEKITADFIYLRLHGHEQLYASCYTSKQLAEWAKKIKVWLKESKDVYLYFDNDAQGYAVKNALTIKEILSFRS